MSNKISQLKLPPEQYSYSRGFPKPIEVFCSTEYKGYYVRGQILDFPYSAGFDSRERYYRFYLLALVSPLFDNTEIVVSQDDYRFGKILGRTKSDFKLLKSSLSKDKKDKLPILWSFKLNDFGIVESNYLKECLEQKQDMILVSLGIEPVMDTSGRKTSWQYIHPFVANYFGFQGHCYEDDVRTWFSHFFDTLCFEFNYKGMSKKEFFQLLSTVGEFSNWALVGDKIIGEYIKDLYAFVDSVSDSDDPLVKFCFSFLDDMLEDMYQRKIIGRCALCGNAYIYDTRKKHCTLLSEGKDCGKSARNKTHYAKNREKLRLKKREEMAEWRKYLKSKNVKKPPPIPRKRG